VSKPVLVLGAATGVVLALMTCATVAQEATGDKATVAPEPRAPLQAPVGHRQPRAADLPSTPGRPEATGAGAPRDRDDTDDKLRICRGC
jgi:hypothetical protein